MTQSEPQKDKANRSTATSASIFTELGETGQQRVMMLIAAQSDLLSGLQELNQRWLARAKSEAEFASELVAKLASTRSGPECVTVCQEWSKRRMEMAVQDSQRLFADGLKLMETSTRLWSNGRTNQNR
jgi:hypothetical protein